MPAKPTEPEKPKTQDAKESKEKEGGNAFSNLLNKVTNQSLVYKRYKKTSKLLKQVLHNPSWGCPTSIMYEIAHSTYASPCAVLVYGQIWEALDSRPSKWTRIFKALELLDVVIKHGAEEPLPSVKLQDWRVRKLFTLVHPPAGEHIMALRKKARAIVDLLEDLDALKVERAKAQKRVAAMNIHGIRGGKENEEGAPAAGVTAAAKVKKEWFSLDAIKGRLPNESSKGMKEDDKQIRVDQVCLVVRCPRNIARQYLEADDWNVDLACSSYLDANPCEKPAATTGSAPAAKEMSPAATADAKFTTSLPVEDSSDEESSSSSSSYESDSDADTPAAKTSDPQRSAMQQRLMELSNQQQAKNAPLRLTNTYATPYQK